MIVLLPQRRNYLWSITIARSATLISARVALIVARHAAPRAAFEILLSLSHSSLPASWSETKYVCRDRSSAHLIHERSNEYLILWHYYYYRLTKDSRKIIHKIAHTFWATQKGRRTIKTLNTSKCDALHNSTTFRHKLIEKENIEYQKVH